MQMQQAPAWRKEADQQHRVECIIVQALSHARATKELAGRHAIVALPRLRAVVKVGGRCHERQG